METSPCFDLNEAVRRRRERLIQQIAFSADDPEELENHLREHESRLTPSRQMPRTCKIWLLAIALAILGVARSHGALSDEALNRLVSAYSAQRVIGLNIGENYAFQLRSGERRVLKLLAVREHRDSVINLMRRAEVQVEIDGKAAGPGVRALYNAHGNCGAPRAG